MNDHYEGFPPVGRPKVPEPETTGIVLFSIGLIVVLLIRFARRIK